MNKTEISTRLCFEIKPYNIDAAGHVNNAVYINWLEDLRIKLFQQILPLEKLIDQGLYLVVASTTIDYKKPLHLFDKPVGKMKVDSYKRGIWYISAIIEFRNKIMVKAKQKCVLVDRNTHKMITSNINGNR